MKRILRTVEINASADRIYEFLMQPTNLPSIWPNMVSVSNIVPGAGGASDFDWEFKMAGMSFKGRTITDEAQPGKLARVHNEHGIPSTFLWTYESLDGTGTRLKLDLQYSIPTPLIGKLAEVLVAKLNERDIDSMLANLKDFMENKAQVATAEVNAR